MLERWGWQHMVAIIKKKWSQCDLMVFPILLKLGLCIRLCFHGHVLFFVLFTFKYLSSLRQWHLWLHCLMFQNPVQEWCLFVLGTTNMDPQGNSSLAGANVCTNPDLQKPTLWVDVHPNNTVLLYVLKPALGFQYSRFNPFQIEKCVQPCVKTQKICVYSCFCLKVPTGPWINCFISAPVLYLTENTCLFPPGGTQLFARKYAPMCLV